MSLSSWRQSRRGPTARFMLTRIPRHSNDLKGLRCHKSLFQRSVRTAAQAADFSLQSRRSVPRGSNICQSTRQVKGLSAPREMPLWRSSTTRIGIRSPLKRHGDGWSRISWEEALDLVARGLGGALKKYGPNSIGFLASSKCTNEENYLIEKLARLLGSPNVDGCARLCHAPSVVGLNRTLGAAGMTNPIAGSGQFQMHIHHRIESR